MIHGLTDHQAAFPIIGILRKGEEKTENKPGKDLTYFRFVSDDADACQHFDAAYPDKEALRRINAFLPHRTADENMESWKEHWVAGGLVHRCDGKTCVLWRNDKGEYSTEPKACPGNCSPVGRLSILIPELGRLATVTLLTTSKWDILNLTRQLRSYEALRGDLRGIPFVIIRKPVKISTPRGNGKRVRTEKWLLSIESQPDWTRLQLTAMAQAALPATIEDDDDGDLPPRDDSIIDVSTIVAPHNGDISDEQPEDQPQKTFNKPDDLFYELSTEFDLTEAQLKEAAKECGYTSFKKTKSSQIYEEIQSYLREQADLSLADQEADMILGQTTLPGSEETANNYAVEEA